MTEKRMKKTKVKAKVPVLFPRRPKLDKAIDLYLKKRSYSGGGWAPVEEEELIQLVEIIDLLICSKYSPDPDGDRPINFMVIDRTSCEPLNFQALPHAPRNEGDNQTARDIFTEAVRFEIAQMNMKIAMSSLEAAARPINKYVNEFTKEAIAMEAAAAKEKTDNPVDVVR